MLKHAVAAVLALAFVGAAHAGKTLDAIKQRGQLVCGVNPSLAGLLGRRQPGQLDRPRRRRLQGARRRRAQRRRARSSSCRSTPQQRFTALQSGEVDILSRNTTWTLTRDASLGLHFTGVTYYDGQGFMVTEEEQDQRAPSS